MMSFPVLRLALRCWCRGVREAAGYDLVAYSRFREAFGGSIVAMDHVEMRCLPFWRSPSKTWSFGINLVGDVGRVGERSLLYS